MPTAIAVGAPSTCSSTSSSVTLPAKPNRQKAGAAAVFAFA